MGQQLLAATEKNMEIWVGMENLVFHSGHNVPNLFLASTKEVFTCREFGTFKTCCPPWSTVRIITRLYLDICSTIEIKTKRN